MSTVPTPPVEVLPAPVIDHPAAVFESLDLPPRHLNGSRLTIIIAPVLATLEFIKHIWSPGLKEVPTLSCIDIRNGGQHRY